MGHSGGLVNIGKIGKLQKLDSIKTNKQTHRQTDPHYFNLIMYQKNIQKLQTCFYVAFAASSSILDNIKMQNCLENFDLSRSQKCLIKTTIYLECIVQNCFLFLKSKCSTFLMTPRCGTFLSSNVTTDLASKQIAQKSSFTICLRMFNDWPICRSADSAI